MVKARLKTSRILLLGLLFTVSWNILSAFFPVKGLTTYFYTALLIFWMCSLPREIADRYALSHLEIGGAALILLFVLRYLRWNVVPEQSIYDRLCWYGYYLPTTVIPLLSLAVVLHIGSRSSRHPRKLLIPLWTVCSCFLVLILTNDLHQLLLHISYTDGRTHSTAGPLYYVLLIWSYGMMLAAYGLLLYKCRISEARRHWRIPILWGGIGLLLWAVYYVCGASSPRIAGVSLYNIQEVYLVIFVGMWESCLLIGLLPTASLVREREWIHEGILKTVRTEMDRIREICEHLWDEEGSAFETDLIRIGCLGAYVKRRANLELIADERGTLASGELSLAIRESFEYYSLAGMSVGYEETGSAEIPAPLIICAYELFEESIEQAQSACYVRVQVLRTEGDEGFRMTVETDPQAGDVAYDLRKKWVSRGFSEVTGAELKVNEEDETLRIELTASRPCGHSHLAGTGRRAYHTGEDMRYGLSGLADYLSLGDEALAARIRVHDGLGRSLLMTKRYLSEPDKTSRDALLMEWARVIAGMEDGLSSAGHPAGTQPEYAACIRQAREMGVETQLAGALPDEPRLQVLADTAITVYITNLIRHTRCRHAVIRSETVPAEAGGTVWRLVLSGDGQQEELSPGETAEPENGTPRRAGGLINLRTQTQALGGSMEVETGELYRVILTVPYQEEQHGISGTDR